MTKPTQYPINPDLQVQGALSDTERLKTQSILKSYNRLEISITVEL